PTFRAIFEAFQEYSVLVFRDQRLTDEQQMAFSERFGPLETTISSLGRENRLHPNLVDLSNLDPAQGGRLMDWTDRPRAYHAGERPGVVLRRLSRLVYRGHARRGVPPAAGRAFGSHDASGVHLPAPVAAV